MEAVHHSHEDLTKRFVVPAKARMFAIVAMLVGALFVGLGFLFPGGHSHDATHEQHEHDGKHHSMKQQETTTLHYVSDTHDEKAHGEHHHEITQVIKTKSAFLIGSYFMLTIALGAMFFMTVHRAANAGWHIAVHRIAEGISMWLPFALVLFVIIWVIGGDLYEWRILQPGEDDLIDSKRAYLNPSGQLIRLFIFMGGWAFFAWFIRKQSMNQDLHGDPHHRDSIFRRLTVASGFYIFFFAITFTLWCFDWVMSLEPHWFSTIFAVNNFAGAMVSFFATMSLIIFFMKKQGYLSFVNESHMHDIGKFMFGFSIFWTYTWLSQYLLIWYANIPEENIYYVKRYLEGDPNYLGFRFFFWFNVVINFIAPFFSLMTRNAKRGPKIMVPIAITVLIGHLNDLFLQVAPGSVGGDFANSGYFFAVVGMMLLLGGAFVLVVLTTISRANLIPLKHPYTEESLHHSTGVI